MAFLVISFSSSISYGQLNWRWGATGSYVAEAYPVATDKKGNVFGCGVNTSGLISSFGGFTVPGTGYQSIWVKYNMAGVVQWAGGTSAGGTSVFDITTDTAGNLIVFGGFNTPTMQVGSFILTNSYSSFNVQYFLAKVSPSGTVLWAVKDGNLAFAYSDAFFGSLRKFGGVATDDSGNIYIAAGYRMPSISIGGHTLTNADASGTTADIFVAKYSPAGTVVWATSIGGTDDDYCLDIAVTPQDSIYITGGYRSSSMTFGLSTLSNTYSNPRAFIAKLSPDGTPLWAQASGDSGGAYGVGLKSDNSGNLYMGGNFADASITFGSTTFTRTFPAAAPNFASFVAKYIPGGTVAWCKTIGGESVPAMIFSVGLSNCGKVWVGGSYDQDLVLAPGDTIARMPGPDPAFMAGYDFLGNVIGFNGLPSGGDDQNEVACDQIGNAYLCGDFEGAEFVLGRDTLLPTLSSESIFIGKYGYLPDTTGTFHHDTLLCATGTATIYGPAGYAYYVWDDGETTWGRSISTGGTYLVYATSCDNKVLTDTVHATFSAPPEPISGPISICRGDSFAYSCTPAGGTWQSDEPAIGSVNMMTGEAKGLSVGSFTITYSMLSGCNVTKTVSVTACPASVAVPESAETLMITPNPAFGQLTITSSERITDVAISNLQGQIVYERKFNVKHVQADISQLQPGIYFIQINKVSVRKFVKE